MYVIFFLWEFRVMFFFCVLDWGVLVCVWCKFFILFFILKWLFFIYFMFMDIFMLVSRFKDLFRVIVCYFSVEIFFCVFIYLEKNVFCMVVLVLLKWFCCDYNGVVFFFSILEVCVVWYMFFDYRKFDSF